MADDHSEPGAEWGMGTGWAIVGTLISGMLVWGGIGLLVDWWLDVKFGLPAGVVIGAAGAVVLIVKRFANISHSRDD
ncbi:MAG TPA: hypothetical protein VHU91_08245 [Mycobacteriales bacterium]|jgi:F0F1-type ATP synthase assembly protein I|nr:hypothetical protein [Mycobacteriales bacterium]